MGITGFFRRQGAALLALAVLALAGLGACGKTKHGTPQVAAPQVAAPQVETPQVGALAGVTAPADPVFGPMVSSDMAMATAQPTRPEPRISLGTGVLIGDGKRYPAPGAALGNEEVILNFADTDIREVVRAVLGDILRLNYVIDPGVSGTVTLQSGRGLMPDQILPTLESVLRLNGAGIVTEGNLYRVVTLEGTQPPVAPLILSPGGARQVSGYGVQIMPLRFASAVELEKVLKPFAPPESLLTVDPGRNLLILAGTREERQAFQEAVEIFDVDWIRGTSFGLFPLRNVRAEVLAEELRLVFGQGEQQSGQQSGVIRFVPLERLNAILAISLQPRYLKEARRWIFDLDRSDEAGSRRIFVYNVQNARANELAAVLAGLFGGKASGSASGSPNLDSFSTRPSAQAVRDLGGLSNGAAKGDGGPDAPTAGEVILQGEEEIRVIAVDSSNALVIHATPQDYRMLEDAVQQLDVLPLQVLIEATILEVSLNDDLRFGVQWFFDSGRSEFTLSELANGTASTIFPGFSYVFQQAQDARVVVNALTEVTDVNIVSSPQLMVLDNQTAELQVGDQVPVATQSAVSVINPQAPIVNSIEFRDTGVLLRVTPRVNNSGLVVLEIEQEVSSVVATTTSGIDSPTIQKRKIASTVAIQSGDSVTLGGLIRDERQKGSSGIPLLSDIPLIGSLFGAKTDEQERTELLVLITPRVVRNRHEAREVTRELRDRMRFVEPLRGTTE